MFHDFFWWTCFYMVFSRDAWLTLSEIIEALWKHLGYAPMFFMKQSRIFPINSLNSKINKYMTICLYFYHRSSLLPVPVQLCYNKNSNVKLWPLNLMTFICLVFYRYLGMDFFKFYHNDSETINIIYDQEVVMQWI